MINLNTSHVTVQPVKSWLFSPVVLDLNTSHVTVQRLNSMMDSSFFHLFKYISCYGSTRSAYRLPPIYTGFKYISCYGSTLFSGNSNNKYIKFKYISCYGSTGTFPMPSTISLCI